MSLEVKLEGHDSRLYSYTKIFGTPTNEFNEYFELPAINVFDQNNTLACVGCAFASAMEVVFGVIASPGVIYATCRDDSHKSPGLYFYRAAELLCKVGFVPFTEFGLITEVPFIIEMVKESPELLKSTRKPFGYCKIDYANKDLKEACLKDAVRRYEEGVSVPIVTNGHCVLLVGWNPETNKFIYQDSYGSKNCRKEIALNKIDHALAFFTKPLDLPFKDVEKEAWYKKHLEHLYYSGIINGVTADTVEPHRYVERCESWAMEDRVLSVVQGEIRRIWEVINEMMDMLKG